VAKIIGGKSGFKTGRDVLLFALGVGILVWHLGTTPAKDLSIPLLIFCGGLIGAPYVIGKDEGK
jgi:uncharacterized membrane protein YdcZ (DUF606 family)